MLGHRALNVEDYLTILKRRWWIILIPAIILPIIAVAATYFITPEFVSTTVVLIDQQKVPTDFVKPVATQDIDSRLAYMEEQVLSRSSIQPIIEKYNLYANQHLSMDQRVELTRKALTIEPVQSEIARSNGLPGFSIAFKGNDPHTAQQVCADITSLFTGVNTRSREADAESTTDFLKSQLASAQRALDDQDTKVADFQREHAGMLPEDQGNNMSVLASLNSQLEATTQQLQNLEQNESVGKALLTQQQQAQAMLGSPTASPVQTAQTQQEELDKLLAEKTDLETRYTSDYPEVKDVNRQIADLRSQMAKAASAPAPPPAPAAPVSNRPDSAGVVQLRAQLHGTDQLIQDKRKQQEQLNQEIRTYEGRIQSSPMVEAEYKALTRDSDTAQAFYNKILAEVNQSNMTTDLELRQEGQNFSVLDAATLPTDPIWPKQSVFAAGGFAGGLAIGVLIVALLEYKDTALRNERDIWSFTQLPTLAVIAWSGEVADLRPAKSSRLKRLFSRKPPKELLADSAG